MEKSFSREFAALDKQISSAETRSVYGKDLHRIPQQRFEKSLEDFLQHVFPGSQESGVGGDHQNVVPEHRRILIFSDGRDKRVLKSGDSDEILSNSLDQEIRTHIQRNLSDSNFLTTQELFALDADSFHASFEHAETLSGRFSDLFRGAEAVTLVVVGGGSLVDVVKHALFLYPNELGVKLRFVVVPTALTVTAFTSAFAVLEKSGAKKTHPSRDVDECVWFEGVLSGAPPSLNAAGFGDLLARFVAYGDWYLAHCLGFAENYQPHSFQLMEPFTERLVQLAPEIGLMKSRNRLSTASTFSLSEALSMAGIVMTLSQETTPLSGFEHVLSHALDFLRLSSGRPLVLHGEQVALGCLASAHVFDWLISQDQILVDEFRKWPLQQGRNACVSLLRGAPYFGDQESELGRSEREAKMEMLKPELNKAEIHFSKEYEKKHLQWETSSSAIADFVKNWGCIRKELRRLTLPAIEMEKLLNQSGLPICPEMTNPPTTALEFRFAARFSPFVRARWSIGDLLYWMDFDPAIVAGI